MDKKLLELCWDNNFYPSYKFDCIEPELIELQKLCLTKKISEIKKLLRKNNLVPDRKCMENASAFKNNNQILEYLLAKGGKITLNCVRKCSEQFNANRFLLKLMDEFKVNNEKDIKMLEDKIKLLENKIIELGGDLDENKKTPEATIEEIEELDAIQQPEDEVDEIVEDEDQSIMNIKMEKENIILIQQQNKRKKLIPKKFQKAFELDPIKKNTMSYTDIKNFIIKKINENSWIDKSNKNLIDFP